ncbi:hypothetical protein AVDCRST_MAG94-1465 [uncultured Leptolyngbya sp.]|uniref:Uncharacterized protein n=1 Tax=uncultured Leptolyngbya sp. TaxID=332963 RepID=A0A6J4L3G8_9CYAN|nr:hypothetical protein AVDCRST_MAG94-1465 [uncultured Leptolyngbya sp.]
MALVPVLAESREESAIAWLAKRMNGHLKPASIVIDAP